MRDKTEGPFSLFPVLDKIQPKVSKRQIRWYDDCLPLRFKRYWNDNQILCLSFSWENTLYQAFLKTILEYRIVILNNAFGTPFDTVLSPYGEQLFISNSWYNICFPQLPGYKGI